MEVDLFGGDENSAAWDLAVNCQRIEKLRVGGDPRAAIDAQGFIDARHKKDHADPRPLYEVAERIDPVVAEPVGNQQRRVVDHVDEARRVALGRGVAAA